jgi:2-dehydropantoate 2-reductase
MRVVVIGAGAVGLGLGSFLLAAGSELAFVARGAPTRAALRSEGLLRGGLFGDVSHLPGDFDVLDSAFELRGREVDCVLVCTKSTASLEVARALAAVWPELPSPPAVVLCQNGWGNAETFAELLPRHCLWNARVITGFRRPTPARVEVTVHAEPVRVGSLFEANAAADDPRISALCAAIARGGLPCELSPDISKDLLAKLLYNCALNPLGAILGVPYGALGDRAPTRALIEAVVREIFEVIEGSGLSTHWSDADAYLEDFYAKLLPPTKSDESSRLQDLRAGRPTEIDAISGAVVGLASTIGVEAPVNHALRDIVHAIEASRSA